MGGGRRHRIRQVGHRFFVQGTRRHPDLAAMPYHTGARADVWRLDQHGSALH